VSERLAEQVLHALYELLRGFQAAHEASKGSLLRQPLERGPPAHVPGRLPRNANGRRWSRRRRHHLQINSSPGPTA